MSVISDIKDDLLKLLDTLTKIQDLANYDKQPAKGFPLVTVTNASNDNAFASTAQNERIFNFRITCYEQMGINVSNPTVSSWNTAAQRAEEILQDVVSDILDVLDENITLYNTVEYVEAVPSDWGYAQTEAGWFRTAEIAVRVHKYKLV